MSNASSPSGADSGGDPRHKQKMLTFRSGGWVLLLAALIVVGIVSWRLAFIVRTLDVDGQQLGDGAELSTYPYDLADLVIPRDQLIPVLSRDGLVALKRPPTVSATDLPPIPKLNEVRKLVTHDRVVGVKIGDEARAYPVWILEWHEIVNDTLGGVPIAVTYSPLTDSAVVFDRRIAGEVREFGVSGLLYNSNLVMFDRQDDLHHESLWSQLGFKAISGPAVGTPLPIIPSRLIHWSAWRTTYPETTVILPDKQKK